MSKNRDKNNNDELKKPSTKDKLQKLQVKLKLDKHHRIERFGVTFLILSSMMCLLLTTILVKKNNDEDALMDSQALYTTQITTSVTGAIADVTGIYENKNETRIFVMWHFDDPSMISTDAANYTADLTGIGYNTVPEPLMSEPEEFQIYMFGSTGYMGVYIEDKQGFPKQIYDLTITAEKQLTEDVNEADPATEETSGETEAKEDATDYFHVYFNPGASDVTYAECLDDDVTAEGIYKDLVTTPKEKELKIAANETLEAMQTDLVAIDEYTDRLARAGITPSETPKEIEGDSIVEEDGQLYLDTDMVIPTGYDYEWQNTSIEEGGYLADVAGDTDYDEYMAMKNQEETADPFSTSDVTWHNADGTVYDPENETTGDASINNDISLLISAWQSYYSHKTTYQCTDLENLLLLEAESMDVAEDCTINDDESNLTVH